METFGPNTRRLFLARGSELRPKTMFGRSIWCRPLALDPFSWRARKCDSNARDAELCVLSDQGQQESERQCARTRSCSGRQRPCTRERSSTPLACHLPAVDYRAFARRVQDVFRSLPCFLGKSTHPHIDVGSNECSPRLVPDTSCARATCFADVLRVPELTKFVAVEHT